MEKIFENAKFGDKFRTRDGRKAIYVSVSPNNPFLHKLAIEDNVTLSYHHADGSWRFNDNKDRDIVSRWQEHINEEELIDLAMDYTESRTPNCWWEDSGENCVCNISEIRYAFKAGYRKAKEDK